MKGGEGVKTVALTPLLSLEAITPQFPPSK